MRRAARLDRNHGEIAGAFEDMGCSVRSLAAVGGGMPDLLVGVAGHTILVEVKDGKKSPSKRKLTDDQQKFKAEWRGQLFYVDSVKDVQIIVNAMRKSGIFSTIGEITPEADPTGGVFIPGGRLAPELHEALIRAGFKPSWE